MIKAALDENNALVKSDTAPRMIGEIKYFAMNTPPSHCLACDGSAVSRTTYAALFAAIGTTWGAGDGSSTFNLPDLRNEWVQGAGTNAVGADIAEGLPNITGSVGIGGGLASESGIRPVSSDATESDTNALYAPPHRTVHIPLAGAGSAPNANAGSYFYDSINLNASRQSSVYGASTHVTPKSKALKACIIYE